MIETKFLEHLTQEIENLKKTGYFKPEYIINGPQGSEISLTSGRKVINFCANNYLGLANDLDLIESGQKALAKYGYGMASVRFICGTQNIHTNLEKEIAKFLNKEEAILYTSCFDANAGLFETLLNQEDAVISDELNHASIIDGIRLCKAPCFRYKNNNMQDLEAALQAAQQKGAKLKMIATDGVFSMDGTMACLQNICDLAQEYNAMVMVDDSHAVGVMGEHGAGTPQYCKVENRVDIVTGTFGKALGGACGGYVAAKKEIIQWLRQRSRPYLFSNTLAPLIACVSTEVIKFLQSPQGQKRLSKLHKNSQYFRLNLKKRGFKLIEGTHPIIPIMLQEAKIAASMAKHLLEEGIYVIAFSFPVVPEKKARIRVQIAATHTRTQLDHALEAFVKIGQKLRVV